jgi:hypothetical protein
MVHVFWVKLYNGINEKMRGAMEWPDLSYEGEMSYWFSFTHTPLTFDITHCIYEVNWSHRAVLKVSKWGTWPPSWPLLTSEVRYGVRTGRVDFDRIW